MANGGEGLIERIKYANVVFVVWHQVDLAIGCQYASYETGVNTISRIDNVRNQQHFTQKAHCATAQVSEWLNISDIAKKLY